MASPTENGVVDEVGLGLGSETVSQDVGATEIGLLDRELGGPSSSADRSGSMSPEMSFLMSTLMNMEKNMFSMAKQINSNMEKQINSNMDEVKHEIGKVNKQMEIIQRGLEEKYDKLFYNLEKKVMDINTKVAENVEDIEEKVDGAMEEIKNIYVKMDENDKKFEEVRKEVLKSEETQKLDHDNLKQTCNGLEEAMSANTRKIRDLETCGVAVVTGSTINANDSGVGDQLLREGIIFTGEEGLHPAEFLNLLESRFKTYSVSSHRRLAFTLQCMKGQCLQWMLGNEFDSFEDFKGKFINHFWGDNAQAVLMKYIYSGFYEGGKQGLPSVYFKRMLRHSGYLRCQIPQEMLVRQLLNHFSMEIRIHLIHLENDATKIIKLLERLECERMIWSPGQDRKYEGSYHNNETHITNGRYQNQPSNFNSRPVNNQNWRSPRNEQAAPNNNNLTPSSRSEN